MSNLNILLTGKYSDLVKCLLSIYELNVTKINKGMYGCVYRNNHNIEIPNPKTEKSFAICLHEIGHKVLKHNKGKKRFIEEFEAWNYALNVFRILEIPIKNNVRNRYKKSIRYSISKAVRRGLNPKKIPSEIKRLIR